MLCCRLLTFLKKNFQKLFWEHDQNGLDPDQDQQSVGPNLGANCLQWLSADDKSLQARKEVGLPNHNSIASLLVGSRIL